MPAKKKKDKPPLAQRIDEVVGQSGFSDEQIAKELGRKSGSGIGHWKTGIREPSVSQLEALAKIVGCSLYWLVTGEDEPPPVQAAVEMRMEQFRRQVIAGADPREAWMRLTGVAVSPEVSALLEGDASALREMLASPLGEDWIRLGEEEREAIDHLVRLLARRPSNPE